MAARFVALLAVVASAQAGIVGSPLLGHGLASPIGLAGARTISVNSGLPLGVASPLGLQLAGARLAGSPLGLPINAAGIQVASGLPLGVASPLGLQLAGARLAGPQLGLPINAAGIAVGRTISGLPLGVSSPLGLQLAGARLAGSPLGLPINAAGIPLARSINGVPLGVSAPLGLQVAGARLAAPLGVAKTVVGAAVDTDYDPNPSYSYAYDVQDALTGDSKNQQESRQGDVVQGSYSLTEPDGTRRTVEYTADPINGFNAVVHRQPLAVAKTVVAAPGIAKIGSLGLASPLSQTIIG